MPWKAIQIADSRTNRPAGVCPALPSSARLRPAVRRPAPTRLCYVQVFDKCSPNGSSGCFFVRALEESFNKLSYEALAKKRKVGCLLGGPTRRRPVLPSHAPPRRPAVRRSSRPVVCPGFGIVSVIVLQIVESKTRTYHGREGAGRRAAGWPGGAGPNSSGRRPISSPGKQTPILPPRASRATVLNDTLGARTKEILGAVRWRNETSG